MVTALTARWLFTAVFAAAGLGASLPRRRGPAGTARPADQISAAFCAAMCAALTAMTWRPEPAAVTWLQAALLGCAALGFGLTSRAGHGRVRQPAPPALLHALMAGTMIWMLTAMPAMTGMTVSRVSPRRDGADAPGRYTRPGARRQHLPGGVLRCCVLPVARAGHRPRTSGQRPGLGQPGRDERGDGGDVARDAGMTIPAQGPPGGGDPRIPFHPRISGRHEHASRIGEGSRDRASLHRVSRPADFACSRTRSSRCGNATSR
jgi:hypothetical protein